MANNALVKTIARLHAAGHDSIAIVNALYRETGLRTTRAVVERAVAGLTQQQAAMAALPPPLPLMQFIPHASPKFHEPRHLQPFIDLFSDIGKRPMRVVGHAPPRHSKTESILHCIAHGVRKDPSLLFGYSTYAMDLTISKSIRARQIAQDSGVKLSREAAKEWRTLDGGGLLATSTGGPLTGHGISGAMFIDDAYKNRVQAESRIIRGTIWDWFSDVVMTRLEPGASVFILMTRWHQDDLGGRALREMGKHKRGPEGQRYCDHREPRTCGSGCPGCNACPGCGPNPIDGFEEIRLPAISDEGLPLWPERWPLSALAARRREVTSYTWFSLYQGIPKARGSSVFTGLAFYDPEKLPKAGFRIAIGIDLSYTESTSADWAVAVVLMYFDGFYYVLEVLREQTTAPKFAVQLKALRQRWRRAPMFSIFYGPEKGSIDFMRTLGIPITGIKRPGDKFVRSQNTAAKWNDSKILVPQTTRFGEEGIEDRNHLVPRTCGEECRGCRYPWLDPFVEVVTNFTGVKDDSDDDVDGLVAAVEGIGSSPLGMNVTADAVAEQKPLPNAEIWRDPMDRSGGFGPADI